MDMHAMNANIGRRRVFRSNLGPKLKKTDVLHCIYLAMRALARHLESLPRRDATTFPFDYRWHSCATEMCVSGAGASRTSIGYH